MSLYFNKVTCSILCVFHGVWKAPSISKNVKKKIKITQYVFQMLPLFSKRGDPMLSSEIYIRGQLVFLPSDLCHLSSEMASLLLLQWLSVSQNVHIGLRQRLCCAPASSAYCKYDTGPLEQPELNSQALINRLFAKKMNYLYETVFCIF